MINYIIQVILFQVLFLAIYDFFLSKETFFTKNRWYLLSTSIVAFLLPLIKIPTLQKAVPVEYTILLPEVVLSPQKVIESSNWYQSIDYVNVLFWLGCVLFAMFFIIKLEKIIRLILKNRLIKKENYTLVLLPKETKAFSFFNFIFLGEDISKKQREKIIQHELVHSKQKHSLDLLLFEILKIVMWFNPMIYIYQKRITLVHEYISDEVITKSTQKEHYINNILSDLFQVESISFINQLYKHSLIKKRIIMMTKQKSKQIKQLKYLLLIPLLASMLVYTACTNNEYFNESTTGLKDYQSIIKVNDVNYYLKDRGDGEVVVFDKDKNKVDLNTILPPGIKSMYFEDGNLISVFKDSKVSVKTKDEFAYEFKENVDVPFSIIEEVPIYPGCVGTRKQKADCLSHKIRKLLANNFNAKLAKTLNLSKGKKKIWTSFRINKQGEIVDIRVRAPHPKLKEEAIRVVNLLPKMTPGKQKGKAVGMKYSVPISFVVE